MEEKEKIIEIEIERLKDFKEHPFQVKDDEEMRQLKDSISEYGVLNPLIVRPRPEGVYEIISGHRRKYASQKLGYTKLPVIIRVMTDEEAIIAMVDSNLQREKISHSEKAYAYMMKNEALKRKGGRKRSQSGHRLKGKKTVELISEASPIFFFLSILYSSVSVSPVYLYFHVSFLSFCPAKLPLPAVRRYRIHIAQCPGTGNITCEHTVGYIKLDIRTICATYCRTCPHLMQHIRRCTLQRSAKVLPEHPPFHIQTADVVGMTCTCC